MSIAFVLPILKPTITLQVAGSELNQILQPSKQKADYLFAAQTRALALRSRCASLQVHTSHLEMRLIPYSQVLLVIRCLHNSAVLHAEQAELRLWHEKVLTRFWTVPLPKHMTSKSECWACNVTPKRLTN